MKERHAEEFQNLIHSFKRNFVVNSLYFLSCLQASISIYESYEANMIQERAKVLRESTYTKNSSKQQVDLAIQWGFSTALSTTALTCSIIFAEAARRKDKDLNIKN